MTESTGLCRKCILRLTPYVPGKPIEEVKRELGIDNVIKLASNENPLGPSPKALEAMRAALENVGQYPEGSCYELRHAVAKHLGVQPDMLIFGSGADEVIHYIGIALLDAEDEIVQAHPSFVQYCAAATLMDCPAHLVPLKNWTHDLDAMLAKVNERTKLFFISNPNNPTGTIVWADEVERVLDALPKRCVMVLDEAYYEYVDDPAYTRSIEWVRQGRNVIVLRTFSKIYALAGLRIGYGVAPAHLIELLERVRLPFNVNSVAQAGAVASLQDPHQVVRTREQNQRSKSYIYEELDKMGLPYTPSQANFVWIDVQRDCKQVFTELMKRGVIVRTGDIFGAPTHIRVTTGTDEQNERFVSTLREVLGLLKSEVIA
ncbi:MAG: histidinol-phosphate transaminase [Armatimonadetes bacterium]|nr:histidinol-phosphate transaminase [Armatimonadota bacterium]